MDEDKLITVSVFSSHNNALFQVAKSLLDENKIKYFSSGDYLNNLEAPVYSAEIRVFEKDEKSARELLSELVPAEYVPSDNFESFLTKNGFKIILISFVIMLLIIWLVKTI
ncbi:MAG: DUF2007 domain-containing protein [Ignavibacteria bacterium]